LSRLANSKKREMKSGDFFAELKRRNVTL
jgi:hypothetical protein